MSNAATQPTKRRARPAKRTPDERLHDSLFAELAKMAEMASIERELRGFGFRAIAGTDEVGRGCLAGPVVAACVILGSDPTLPGVRDSKMIDVETRTRLLRLIVANARAISIGVVEAETIDRINILRASKLAMHQAVEDLQVRPDILLLDAVTIENLEMPQVPIIGGDRRSLSIAAASIVAKVYRDLLMESYHERYPVYDFKHNRGYATEGHQAALRMYGPSPIHRKSFEGVEEPRLLFGISEEDGDSTR